MMEISNSLFFLPTGASWHSMLTLFGLHSYQPLISSKNLSVAVNSISTWEKLDPQPTNVTWKLLLDAVVDITTRSVGIT